MWNNFHKNGCSEKKYQLPELKLQSKGLSRPILEAYLCLNFSRGLLQIFHIFVCNFPGTFLQTNVQKILKSGSRSSSACNALNFFQQNPQERSFSLHIIFFPQSRFTEIIRHQILIQTHYRNFARICLLVKMASETLTRSIASNALKFSYPKSLHNKSRCSNTMKSFLAFRIMNTRIFLYLQKVFTLKLW